MPQRALSLQSAAWIRRASCSPPRWDRPCKHETLLGCHQSTSSTAVRRADYPETSVQSAGQHAKEGAHAKSPAEAQLEARLRDVKVADRRAVQQQAAGTPLKF